MRGVTGLLVNRLVLLLILAVAVASANAKVRMLPFERGRIPAALAPARKVVNGARWIDRNGENLLVLSRTDFRRTGNSSGDETTWTARLNGVLLVKQGSRWKPLWRLADGIEGCPVDLTADFVPGSLTVTDLDGDEIGEAAFLYRLACRGDVSPSTQKLILREGTAKYAIRGETRIRIPGTPVYGGSRRIDASFAGAPLLRRHAIRLWDRFRDETFR